jgi:hypothetical protein
MAGTNAAFDSQAFKDGIHLAMNMALPGTVADRATFRWRVQKTFSKQDTANRPYDWTATELTTDARADVQVPCAVEFSSRTTMAGQTAMGHFDSSKAVITLLDEDYALVEGADEVLLGQNTYVVDFVAPPIGLFNVTIYQMYCSARDES